MKSKRKKNKPKVRWEFYVGKHRNKGKFVISLASHGSSPTVDICTVLGALTKRNLVQIRDAIDHLLMEN